MKTATLSESRVKELVRQRDGNRCTRCGVDEDSYRELTGRRLDVHRSVQGPYVVENCVTVCEDCHHAVQEVWGRRSAEPGEPRRVRLVLDDAELRRAEQMATDVRLSVASFLRALVVADSGDWPARMEVTRAVADKLAGRKPPRKRK